jgi:hypothetical protein
MQCEPTAPLPINLTEEMDGPLTFILSPAAVERKS